MQCKYFFDKNIKQPVIPVKTGIHNHNSSMDSRLRGNDTGGSVSLSKKGVILIIPMLYAILLLLA